jgi:hypothetical protein
VAVASAYLVHGLGFEERHQGSFDRDALSPEDGDADQS